MKKNKIKDIFSIIFTRGKKTAFANIVSTIIFLGILLVVNYILSLHNYRFDLSKNKLNSLSKQTENVLNHLNAPVEFIAFVKDGPDKDFIKAVIDKYKYIMPEKINLKTFDPNKYPLESKKYEITSYGIIVIKYKNKTVKIEKIDEETITNAIIKITRAKTKNVYFVEGHGEISIENESSQGLSRLKNAIQEQGYNVESINLVKLGGIPDNADILIIPEPKNALLEKEISILQKFYTTSGSLLILKGPEIERTLHDVIKSLNKTMAPAGLKLRNDFIVETEENILSTSIGLSNAMPLADSYSKKHKITENFNEITFYPISQSIEISKKDDYNSEQIAGSSITAIGLINPKSGEINIQTAPHRNGPLSLVAISEKVKKTGKLILFASSLFATNQYIGHAANSDIILNTISYMLNDSDLISIRMKKDEPGQFKMTLPWLPFLSVYLLPFLILIFGISFWIRRRRA